MPFSKQFWRPWAAVALAVAGGAALGVAQAKAADYKSTKPEKAAKATAQPRKASASAAAQRSKPAKSAKSANTTSKASAAAKVPKVSVQSDAEARLLKVIALVQQQKLDDALKAAASLTADVPTFQAAQLVYADLLRYKTGKPGSMAAAPVSEAAAIRVKHTPVTTASAPIQAPEPDTLEQLHSLQDEIKRRVQGANTLPATGSIPAEFLALAPNVRQAIAIDASKSRLYLFSNEGGKLRLTGDYYVTVGKLGMGKLEEGDQRTPQGIYFIGREIPGVKLPEFYGKGALTVNYPNDWDRAVGRSGSGIWLHGAPPDQFARLPQASDGCMVLSNADLIQLMRTVGRMTPVLVRERLQWQPAADNTMARDRDAFMSVLGQWSQAWSRADAPRLQQLYTADWRASASGQSMQDRMGAAFKSGNASLQDVSVYAWKDAQGEIRVANFRVKSRDLPEPLPLRQYWRKQGAEWKLFSEDVQG
ncbi:MAG: L,D-transpeptidase family protein [Comamonas sp.]